MDARIMLSKQDLTYLKWSHIRSSSGTAGTFLKSEETVNGAKLYYKLSNFDPVKGVIGHECVNEIIVDRLLNILDVPHIHYELVNADIEIEGKVYQTYLCRSEDYKSHGESKTALDNYYRVNAIKGESHYDFCVREGWRDYVDTMLAVDFLILNRDRHGANIEVLRNARAHTIRLAPLFDHGLSLLYSCMSDDEAAEFNILEDKRCNNFIGSTSCYENLKLIADRKKVFKNKLNKADKDVIFEEIKGILSDAFIDKIWDMIYSRYKLYEEL